MSKNHWETQPRDEYGKFANSGTPRTYRQNASYSEIASSSQDAELAEFDEYVAKLICKAYGIDPGEDAKQSFYEYFENKMQEYEPAIEVPEHKFKLNPKYISKSDKTTPIAAPDVEFPRDHLSILKTMWSDYEEGKCKPPERKGIKFFNIDNTIYITIGEYPNFYVTNAKTYDSTFNLESALKRIMYGKHK